MQDRLAINGGALAFTFGGGQSAVGIDYEDGTNLFRFRASAFASGLNTTHMSINRISGNVGIATSPSGYRLDVNGSTRINGGVDLSHAATLAFNGRGHIQTNEILYIQPYASGGQVIVGGGGGPGNFHVTGTLSKAGGSFKIDHPLDPENKFLYHSFVESPDMMNIYNGLTTTDAAGYATVILPDYFEALNREFRYQLTVVDDGEQLHDFVLARVVRKIDGNQFSIKTSHGNVEVSWQVTGVRKDAWAEKNRIPNVVDKKADERGKYMHPEAFNQPLERGEHFLQLQEAAKPAAAAPAPGPVAVR